MSIREHIVKRSGYLAVGAVLAIALLGVTAIFLGVLLVDAREDARQATLEIGETERELDLQRSTNEQAQEERDSRVQAPEEGGQEVELQSQELELRIQALSSNIEALEERRDALQESGTALRSDILRLVLEVSNLEAQILALEQDNADLRMAHQIEVTELDAQILALEQDKADLRMAHQIEVTELDGEISALEQDNADLRAAHLIEVTKLDGKISALEIEATKLDEEIRALEQDNADLRAAHGTVVSLEEQAQGLRVVISGLENDRRALELKAREMFPVCTGSMEPKITCLDTVVVLENFFPEDIEVGTIIFYDSPAAGDGGLPILHRVTEIKIENGIYYFWPKGDAVDSPDGVWVPEGDVRGYVIELLQGTRPENMELRDRVNGAKDLYISTRRTMLEARGVFDETAIRYCGSVEAVSACQTSTSNFNTVLAAYNTFRDAYDEYLIAICAYDKAYYRGLHESAPTGGAADPYETPSICSGVN
ncbi:MAG: hypothetical protein OXC55_09210 [Chloroflexi bacterium]|nr:hypothetical protein [Chloroflexota bacterium]